MQKCIFFVHYKTNSDMKKPAQTSFPHFRMSELQKERKKNPSLQFPKGLVLCRKKEKLKFSSDSKNKGLLIEDK